MSADDTQRGHLAAAVESTEPVSPLDSATPSRGLVEETMNRIRATLGKPESVAATPPNGLTTGGNHLFPDDVYRCLHQMRTVGGMLRVEPKLGWRTPVIGYAWMLLRERIHREIHIYIDALTSQQAAFNSQTVRALTQVVQGIDGLGLGLLKRNQLEVRAELTLLREEVQLLRAEVSTLRERDEMARLGPGA